MSDTEHKDARGTAGVACTVAAVAAGTLPHEAPAGGWEVYDGSKWGNQPAVTVTTAAAL